MSAVLLHPQPEGTATQVTATLIIAGDLCAAGAVGTALSSAAVDSVWCDAGEVIQAADFAIVNLESPLTDDPRPISKSGPSLWGPPSCAPGIRSAGFAAVSLANNHIMDAGPAALTQTISLCHDAGLKVVGAAQDYASATRPLVEQVAGLDVAVLAIAENEFSTTSGPQPGAWPLDPVANAMQIRQASQESDFVLVILHGGAEHHPLPYPGLQKTCRFFVEMGADAVVCHHTHVASGYEAYKGRAIFYGTGNLLFEDRRKKRDEWFTGYLVRLVVGCHETLDAQPLPYRQDPAVPTVRLMSEKQRETFLSRMSELNRIVSDPDRLRASWASYCRQRRSLLLGTMLCLTKPESWLFDKGLLPAAYYRLAPRRLAKLRNLFSCESHRDSCEQMLRDLLEEKHSA